MRINGLLNSLLVEKIADFREKDLKKSLIYEFYRDDLFNHKKKQALETKSLK